MHGFHVLYATVKEEIFFVGEKFWTLPHKTFRTQFNFVLSRFLDPLALERSCSGWVLGTEEWYGIKFSIFFNFMKATKLKSLRNFFLYSTSTKFRTFSQNIVKLNRVQKFLRLQYTEEARCKIQLKRVCVS